jgi:hypothetical protein
MKPVGTPPSQPASVVAYAPPQRSRTRQFAYAAGLLLAGGALATALRPSSPATPVFTPPAIVSVTPTPTPPATADAPVIEIAFVVDTTGSMGGLLAAAKKKIWTICNELADAQPRPRIRLGLVAFRDHGDDYLTKRVALTDDLDAFYSELQGLRAKGGGDAPEAVDQGLAEAVHQGGWSEDADLKLMFLVGDAPAHTARWSKCLELATTMAKTHGIALNTLQCGEATETQNSWKALAAAGSGHYLQIDQNATVTAVATPLDQQIALAQGRIESTALFFGTARQQEKSKAQWAYNGTLAVEEYVSRSSCLNKTGGYYGQDLLDNLAKGKVSLDDLTEAQLPPELRALAPTERRARVARLKAKRAIAQAKLADLVAKRDAYLRTQRHDDTSFDRQLIQLLKAQSSSADLSFDDRK